MSVYDPAADPDVIRQDDPAPGTAPPKPEPGSPGETVDVDSAEDATEGPSDPPW